MYTYISTCASGTTDIISRILKEQLTDFELQKSYDGLLIYRSSSRPADVKQIRGINNTFAVVKLFTKLSDRPVEQMIYEAVGDQQLSRTIHNVFGRRRVGVRIVTMEDNQSVPLHVKFRDLIEEKLGHIQQVWVNRKLPDSEIWFSIRREGFGFVGIRLTMNKISEKELEAGQLRPEIAHILCYLSQPRPTDVVLDPFVGYGAIVLERTNFKYSKILAIDNDEQRVFDLEQKVLKQNKKIEVKFGDGLDLKQVEDQSVDVIVTDPPWGIFDRGMRDMGVFYEKMVGEFVRVLKNDGRCIVLTAQKEIFEMVCKKFDTLELKERYDVLVSGKKAGIYVLSKH